MARGPVSAGLPWRRLWAAGRRRGQPPAGGSGRSTGSSLPGSWAPLSPAPLTRALQARPAPPRPQPRGQLRTGPSRKPLFALGRERSAGRLAGAPGGLAPAAPAAPGAGPGQQGRLCPLSAPGEPFLPGVAPGEDGDVLGCGGRGPSFLHGLVPAEPLRVPPHPRKPRPSPGRGPGENKRPSEANAPRSPESRFLERGVQSGKHRSPPGGLSPRTPTLPPPLPLQDRGARERVRDQLGLPGPEGTMSYETGVGVGGPVVHELASPCPLLPGPEGEDRLLGRKPP